VLAPTLRRAVAEARPGFRVKDIRTQIELNQTDTFRERLLALVATFFAGVAMLLSGVGLYGVLDYSVMQRRREIGIRLAIGAQASDIARRITIEGLVMVVIGAFAGLGIVLIGIRYVQSLLYQVRFTDPAMIAVPLLTILVAALVATLPPTIRAIRTDPVSALRNLN
jgi:ABC-type antimicrobial peptide transport system permease subunit